MNAPIARPTQLAALDFNRTCAPLGHVSAAEWTHLSLCTAEVALVVNFSLEWLNRVPSYRLTTLLFGERILGSIREISPRECQMPPGVNLQRFGASHLAAADDTYRLELEDPELGLRATLELVPTCQPSLTSNMELPGGGLLNWLVIPQLLATGEIEHKNRVWQLRGVPAYRDRNWGARIFTGDTSWDWGYAIGECDGSPMTFVVTRLLNRTRSHTLQQNVFLWADGQVFAIFRAHDVTISEEGALRVDRIPTFPPALRLAVPGNATGLPEKLVTRVCSSAGHLTATFHPNQPTRILIPRSEGQGLTKLMEALGYYEIDGRVSGRSIRLTCPGFFERVHA